MPGLNRMLAKPSRWMSFVGAIVLLPVPFAAAQVTPPQQSSTSGSRNAVPLNSTDPRRAEIQPSLSVDRDPVPSPDVETPESPEVASASSNVPSHGSELAKDKNGIYTLHQNVDEVLLSCTVIDEKGRPVEDLTQKDFRVWEDNAPQSTSSFRHQDLPVSLGILVDNSGSMRDKRTAVNGAAMNLLRESNPKDAAFIVNFNDHAYLDQGFTSDLVALHRGLAHFDTRGTTALFDAVAASADELAKHAKLEKQVLLIVSDGADNASRLNEQEAIRRVQNLGGPVVYTIGLLYDSSPREYERAHESLQSLSDDTGGIAYFPRSLGEVDKIASEVAEDIRNQYTVGYHSTKSASLGGYRVVHVEVNSPHHGKLTVRTRRGYYAKPAVVDQTAQGATRPQNP
jgi:Ca-activated chloride channel family protein